MTGKKAETVLLKSLLNPKEPCRDLLTATSPAEQDHFGAGSDRYFTELRRPFSRVWQAQMQHVMISVQDGGDEAPEECVTVPEVVCRDE